MSCTILSLPEILIGTAQCICTSCYETCLPLKDTQTRGYQPLRAQWTVGTDEEGNRQLRMR